MKHGLSARCVELAAEVADLQQTFDLQWEADMRAVKLWREAHPGNELVLPDRANMVVWLLERLDATLAAETLKDARIALCERLVKYSDDIHCIAVDRNLANDLREAEACITLLADALSASPPEQPAAAPVTGKGETMTERCSCGTGRNGSPRPCGCSASSIAST